MENASKALIIAGGVLVGILIISISIYIILQFSQLSQAYDDRYAEDRKNEINSKFNIYARDITAQELVTLINRIVEYNSKLPSGDEKIIKLTVNNENFLTKTYDEKIKMMKEQKDEEPRYKFEKITYDSNTGLITEMIYKTT